MNSSVQRELQEANALHQRGDLVQAERKYAEILARNPRNPDVLALLGALNLQRGDHDRALQYLQTALTQRPAMVGAHNNIAQIYIARRDLPKAEAHLREAIKLDPKLIVAHRTLAQVLYAQRRRPEAIKSLLAAAALDPTELGDVLTALKLHREGDELDAVLALADRALAKLPSNADFHIARAEVYFERGRLAEGWRELEWRFAASQIPVPRKSLPFPEWQGQPLAGKSLFVWREQGIGDEIMYASLFGDLVAAGARVVAECNPRLIPLFARSFPGVEFVAENTRPAAGERFDYHAPIGSLGRWLRTNFAAFPKRESYLRADAGKAAALRAKYTAGLAQPFVIGIAWKSLGVEFAASKSASLAEWGPILGIPGVRFVNVQYGDGHAEIAAVRQGFGADIVEDAEVDVLKDLDAAAAQIAALDMIVTTSNTAAHLAGALGIPAICMLPKTLGLGRRWYWFTHQAECPWYPRVKFRIQTQEGLWSDPIAHAALATAEAAAAKGAVAKPLAYLLSLAKGYTSAGLLTLADAVFAHADAQFPNTVQVLYEWSRVKTRQRDLTGALAKLDAALRTAPNEVELNNARGMTLMELGRRTEAVEAYEAALKNGPNVGELHNNLGTALRALGRSEDAQRVYQRALDLMPDLSGTKFNLGGIHNERGEIEQALAYYDDILATEPEHADAHANKAQALLRSASLTEGWREFAWRFRQPAANVRPEHFPSPVWAGQPLDGRTVLIWTEQGIGDEIMVASFVPDVLAKARKVVLLCSQRLIPLFKRSFPGATVGLRDLPLPAAATAPDIDFQMSLSELGLALRPDIAAFPARKSFLVPDAKLRKRLRAKYEAVAPGNRIVGISWKSPLNNEIGFLKSQSLAAWLPILQTPGVTFVNLQYGDVAEDLRALEAAHGVKVIADPEVDPLKDMDAAAAQIAAMDHVVSTSNTAVHVAGGLGIPTYVMIAGQRGRNWYWFLDRADSPWYPSLRLYAATETLQWDGVIAQVAADLRAALANG